MSNHTPGPWLFDENSEAITTNNRVTNGKTHIAAVTLGWAEPFESEQVANARLIAAAPELLDALRALLDALPSATTHPAIKAARAAIAKATEAKP